MDFNLTEQQRMFQRAARTFGDRELEPRAAQMDAEGRVPDDLIGKMAGVGLLGISVPATYGGGNAEDLTCVLAMEQLAYSGAGGWWIAGMNNSVPICIARFGTEEQKQKYLPPLCNGSAYASLQFTEDETGSDPDALKTRAVESGGNFILNGSKRFSTFGGRDGYAIVFAREPDGKCTSFIVKKNSGGYTCHKVWDVTGAGGIEAADVSYDNLEVAGSDLFGIRGKGFQLLLAWVSHEKVIQCAGNVGMAQAAIDEAVKYARLRVSRGKAIADMQGIRWMLADMEARLVAARWMTYRAASLLDAAEADSAAEAAKAKIFVIPATISIVDAARQVHGAYGYAREFKVERLYRAVLGASGIATSLEINKSIVGASLVR